MTANVSHGISAALIGAGALVWAYAGKPLVENAELDVPLNPMGVKCSPYGEVFAMAMQGPIDSYWVQDLEAKQAAGVAKRNARRLAEVKTAAKPSERFRMFLDGIGKAATARTNPQPASEDYHFHVRRQIEDKLKVAYELDPTNYGNFASYHFYLTEPTMGTRPELTEGATELAKATIDYCLKQEHDPRPALTAAAAACNILELLFNDQKRPIPRYPLSDIRDNVDLLDRCITRHDELARGWEAAGHKSLLSGPRLVEYNDRLSFVLKIREAAKGALQRIESSRPSFHVTN